MLEQDGVPIYYGEAANLIDSGTGTVTVPLLGGGSKLADGDYTMRFYVEDRTDGIYFASDTVDLEIRVADSAVSITNMGEVTNHTHSFGSELKFDETNHWHECSCGEKTIAEAHSYDGEQAPTCNVCGYVRELSHTHVFGTDWESDAFSHWHRCSSCGARDAEAAHVYDNVLDAECNVCKFKRVISHVHQGVLVSGTPATCTQEGSKDYYTCICEQAFEDEACTRPITDLDSWKVIQPIPHIWSGTYLAENADESKHYHLCTVCGTKDAGEAHVYDNTEDIDCSICGYARQVTPPVGTEFTVNFDPNGGSVSPSSAVTADGKLTNLPTPTRGGYNFAGWYSEPVGGQPVTVNTAFTKNTTIYAHWEKQDSGNSGSINDDSEPNYSVSLPDKVTGGELSMKKRYAEEGETFRFTVTPDEGYELDSLSVIDKQGNELGLRYEGDGEYSFKMPAGRVEIKASFRQIAVELPFTDVPEDYRAHDEIAWVFESGYMSGTSAATFNPGGTDSRQQVWMILARMAGADPANMAEAKAWTVANGISDGTNPGGAVTRQQLATLLYRYAVQYGYDVSVGESTNILSFTDVAQVSEYAIPAMQWACGAGIINGTGDGSTLSPQGSATRAQLAVMLYRWLV